MEKATGERARMERANVSDHIVRCLEAEGVEVVFGIPGEENIHLVRSLHRSEKIRFVLVRHEQSASFMADAYGRVTGKPGVCLATLGPGAINLLLGVANAQLDSHPVVALVAQAGMGRLYKETHQAVDLAAMFAPVTKYTRTVGVADSAGEIVRKAFKTAAAERPGAACIIVPEDVAVQEATGVPLLPQAAKAPAPDPEKIAQIAQIVAAAKRPILLAGHGVARGGASAALRRFVGITKIPVATTFLGKGVVSDRDPLCLGPLGFMVHDHTNFRFDAADLVIAVGYDLVEYPPSRFNPQENKPIIHIGGLPAEVDAAYQLAAGIEGSIGRILDELGVRLAESGFSFADIAPSGENHRQELEEYGASDAFPVKPQRIVSDVRASLGDGDILLCDTGALKMWMARLYPTYEPETCLISNGLATMAFALPGAIGVKLAKPEARVVATMGDGSYMMTSHEIETSVREGIPLVVLVWVDGQFGLIKWKMELELGESCAISFGNPDFVKHAESLGARGVAITSAAELRPALERALDSGGVTVIACPVDYSENLRLTDRLAAR